MLYLTLTFYLKLNKMKCPRRRLKFLGFMMSHKLTLIASYLQVGSILPVHHALDKLFHVFIIAR